MKTLSINAINIATQGDSSMNTQLSKAEQLLRLMQSKAAVVSSLQLFEEKTQEALEKLHNQDFTKEVNKASIDGVKSRSYTIGQTVGLINAVTFIENLGGRSSVLGSMIFSVLVANTSFFYKEIKKQYMGGWYNSEADYRRALIGRAFDQDTSMVNSYNDMLKYVEGFHNKTEVNADGETITNIYKGQDIFVEDVHSSAVEIAIYENGINFRVGYGKTIKMSVGGTLKFKNTTSFTVKSEYLNKDLEKALKSVVMHHHDVETRVQPNGYAQQVVNYNDKALRFFKRDAFAMLLVFKASNIDLLPLIKAVKNGESKKLIVTKTTSNKNASGFRPVEYPAMAYPSKYLLTGPVASKEAKNGYVSAIHDLTCLVKMVDVGEKGVSVLSSEFINKAQSRHEKLNEHKALWETKTNIFLILGLQEDFQQSLNRDLAGGPILTNEKVFLQDGSCRYVTPMLNGGIKSSSIPLKKLDKDLYKGDECVLAPNAFKGGMAAAARMLLGQSTDDLLALHYDYDAIRNKYERVIHDNVEVRDIGGVLVMGVVLKDVALACTNAYSVDNFRLRDKSDEVIDFADEQQVESVKTDIQKRTVRRINRLVEEVLTETTSQNGLRNLVLEARKEAFENGETFNLATFIEEGLASKTIYRKSLTTRINHSELQTAQMYYGTDVAQAWLKEILAEQLDRNGLTEEKIYALEYLGALERNVIGTISAEKVVEVLINTSRYNKISKSNANYSKETIKELMSLLPSDHSEHGWVEVVYPSGAVVEVPYGSSFFNDLEDQMKEKYGSVFAKAMFSEMLENIKSCTDDFGVISVDSKNHLNLDAVVQRSLLGKSLGYQTVKGFYGVALPLIGTKGKSFGVGAAGITNRDRLLQSDDTWAEATLAKAPQYFEGMMATYLLCEVAFGRQEDLLLECAVFVSPEIVLMHQNDFDGDMYRITIGSALPQVERLYDRFNGQYFKSIFEGELSSNVLRCKQAHKCTLVEYHQAIMAASVAKENVGLFTANSYFYEVVVSNLIGKSIDGVMSGTSFEVTEKDAYILTNILKMLIQVEAMDNMKQTGSTTFISHDLLNYKLRNKSAYNGRTALQNVVEQLGNANRSLNTFVKNKGIDLSKEDIIRMLDVVYACALQDSKELLATTVHKARVVETSSFEEISAYISGESATYEGNFLFKDRYFEIVENKADQTSMHVLSLVMTTEALEASLV